MRLTAVIHHTALRVQAQIHHKSFLARIHTGRQPRNSAMSCPCTSKNVELTSCMGRWQLSCECFSFSTQTSDRPQILQKICHHLPLSFCISSGEVERGWGRWQGRKNWSVKNGCARSVACFWRSWAPLPERQGGAKLVVVWFLLEFSFDFSYFFGRFWHWHWHSFFHKLHRLRSCSDFDVKQIIRQWTVTTSVQKIWQQHLQIQQNKHWQCSYIRVKTSKFRRRFRLHMPNRLIMPSCFPRQMLDECQCQCQKRPKK